MERGKEGKMKEGKNSFDKNSKFITFRNTQGGRFIMGDGKFQNRVNYAGT